MTMCVIDILETVNVNHQGPKESPDSDGCASNSNLATSKKWRRLVSSVRGSHHRQIVVPARTTGRSRWRQPPVRAKTIKRSEWR
ncbi:MAG: hypothetical protein MZV64_17515 [Ignavibacteriales bacterium]|nr:hypothetical protein [Ignavibacteriales bacterium]